MLVVEHISAKSLRSKLVELQASRQEVADSFDLGALLHIRGNISTYNGQREIKAFYCGVYTVDGGHFYDNKTFTTHIIVDKHILQ